MSFRFQTYNWNTFTNWRVWIGRSSHPYGQNASAGAPACSLVCYTASSLNKERGAALALESGRIRAYSRYQLLPRCQRNC